MKLPIQRFNLSSSPFGTGATNVFGARGAYMSPNPMGDWCRYEEASLAAASIPPDQLLVEKQIIRDYAALICDAVTTIVTHDPNYKYLIPVRENLNKLASISSALKGLAE